LGKDFGKLAHRYAQALLKAVESELGTAGSPTPAQQVAVSLESFAQTWAESRELSQSIVNPMYERDERLCALVKIAEMSGLPPVALRFLKIVFERERIAAIADIARAFSILADRSAGLVHVQVTTARELSNEDREFIRSELSRSIGSLILVSWEIDPELLGGMVVRYSGQVLDGSLAGQISRLESDLLS